MIIQQKKRNIDNTIKLAFDLVLEYHSTKQILGTNKWLREIKVVNPGLRRMFYFVQQFLSNSKIDITNDNKEIVIEQFKKEWDKLHKCPSKIK